MTAGAGKRVVIVGGGQAAGAVQRKLRQLGFAGQVVLISDEAHAPYERPPLSKEYLCGSESTLRTIAPGRQANEQIRLDCSAVRIDADARTVLCGDGTSVCFDALVLATGAGAEMRSAMGVAVFAGMIGVTAFGLFLTPVFYVLLRQLTGNRPLRQHGETPHFEGFASGGADVRPLPAAPLTH